MATQKLTDKQKRFIDEYVIDFNATQAAIRAGYSKRTANEQGSQNLAKVSIQAELQKKCKKIEEKSDLSQQWVLDRLEEITDRCLQRIPVMYFDKEKKEYVQEKDADGEGVWTFQPTGANKAVENIGRHLGMFNDKLTLDGTVNSVVTIFELPDNGRSDATDTTEDNQATTG